MDGHAGHLTVANTLANSYRFDGQPKWFDFWNCRVTLPDRGVYFYVMPFILSGSEVPAERVGMRLYDGGNGGDAGGPTASRCNDVPIAEGAWSASTETCNVRWRNTQGKEQWFTDTHIKVDGPTTRWDVTIESFLFDRLEAETDPRRIALEERAMLRQAPFIHRVPRMKGYASGTIEQDGVVYEFDRGIVYQAKNHGIAIPKHWTWIHANQFEEDEALAFEAAGLLNDKGQNQAMIRIITPDGVRMISAWNGDQVSVVRKGDEYHIEGEAKDGSLTVSARGLHKDNVVFTFPSPDGTDTENDESFVGDLSVTIDGRAYHARFPALGYLHRI